MNTKVILDEIAKLEREKVQAEVREDQLRKEKAKIEEALRARGLTVKDLDGRIDELRAQVNDELGKLGLAHRVEAALVGAGPADEFDSI